MTVSEQPEGCEGGQSFNAFKKFSDFEAKLFKDNKEDFSCTKCGARGSLGNAGVGGNATQGGFSTIQVLCSIDKEGCGQKVRLPTLLEQLLNEAPLNAWQAAKAYFTQEGLAAKVTAKSRLLGEAGPPPVQTKLKFAGVKRKSEESAPRVTILTRVGPDGSVPGVAVPVGAQGSVSQKSPAAGAGSCDPATVLAKGADDAGNEVDEGAPNGAEVVMGGPPTVKGAALILEPSEEGEDSREYWKARALATERTLQQLVSQMAAMQVEMANIRSYIAGPRGGPAARPAPQRQAPVAMALVQPALPGSRPPVVAVEPQPVERSYAEMARTGTGSPSFSKRTIRRRAATLLLARTEEPLEFAKVHVKMTDSRQLKKCKSSQETNQLIGEAIRHIGARRETFAFSKIGNSMLELYVPAKKLDEVKETIKRNGAVVEEGFDATAIPVYTRQTAEQAKAFAIRRLAFLYRRATLVNLRSCILSGFPEDVQQAVRVAAAQAPAVIDKRQ